MNCSSCNTSNQEGAKFCMSCGTNMNNTPPDQTVKYLLALLFLYHMIFLFWFIIQKVIVPIFFKKDDKIDWEIVEPIYKYLNWAVESGLIFFIIILAFMVKNKYARIIIIICLVVRIILFGGYELLKDV